MLKNLKKPSKISNIKQKTTQERHREKCRKTVKNVGKNRQKYRKIV